MAATFQLQSGMTQLPIDSSRVLRLYQSQGLVSVSLPGYPVQQVMAYLCLYRGADRGLELVTALHLQQNKVLVFYRYAAPLPTDRVGAALREGNLFNESMGFVLDDLAYHHLSEAARSALWDSLPLQKGPVVPAERTAEAKAEAPPSRRGAQDVAESLGRRKSLFLKQLGKVLASF